MPEVKKIPLSIDTLSGKLRQRFTALKSATASFSKAFAAVEKQRKEIAHKFYNLFGDINKERTSQGQSAAQWPEYVRLYFPDLPMEPGDERDNHRGMQAANYLRNLARPKGRTAGTQNNEKPTVKLGRALATCLALVRPEDRERVWVAIAAEFRMEGQSLKNLRAEVAQSKPIFTLPKVKPQAVESAQIVHMPPRIVGTLQNAAENLTVGGKRVRVETERQRKAG